MIAVVCREFGPPESLVLQDVPPPVPAHDEVTIGVRAASVNLPDNLIINGQYQVKPPLPFVPGFEVAGVVTGMGTSVRDFRIGDRVMALTRGECGGFAHEAVAKAWSTDSIPDGMDFVTATAFYSSYGTSAHALVQRGRLQPGENLLVLGAAGGVGLATIEIAKALGARVIAAAGGADKLAAAREHGADDLIDYRGEDLRERVLALTDGHGVDVCLDTVGGDAFDVVSRTMRRQGRLLVVGFASGRIPLLPTNLLLLKGYEVIGVWWNKFVEAEPLTQRENSRLLACMYAKHEIRPVISETFELSDIARALRAAAGRGVVGKLVMTMPAGPEQAARHHPTIAQDGYPSDGER
jgi:NADPH2:quinone reductase